MIFPIITAEGLHDWRAVEELLHQLDIAVTPEAVAISMACTTFRVARQEQMAVAIQGLRQPLSMDSVAAEIHEGLQRNLWRDE